MDILAFLAEDQERLVRFLDSTGLDPTSLRRAAVDPGFAVSLFDYLCADERLLLGFAAQTGRDPAALEAVRQRLDASGEGLA